jgi:hypothetical protein
VTRPSLLTEIQPAPAAAAYLSPPNEFQSAPTALAYPSPPIELQQVPMTGYNTISAHLSPLTDYDTVLAHQSPLTELPLAPTDMALFHYGYSPGELNNEMICPLLNGEIDRVDQNGFDDAAFATPAMAARSTTPGNTVGGSEWAC